MEPTLDFNTGEESVITLEYERLGNHCSTCFWLSHLQSQCPERESGSEKPQSEPHRNCPRYLDTLADTRSSSRDPRSHVIPLARPFQQRVDRHGRPFGDRISTAAPRPTKQDRSCSEPRSSVCSSRELTSPY